MIPRILAFALILLVPLATPLASAGPVEDPRHACPMFQDPVCWTEHLACYYVGPPLEKVVYTLFPYVYVYCPRYSDNVTNESVDVTFFEVAQPETPRALGTPFEVASRFVPLAAPPSGSVSECVGDTEYVVDYGLSPPRESLSTHPCWDGSPCPSQAEQAIRRLLRGPSQVALPGSGPCGPPDAAL